MLVQHLGLVPYAPTWQAMRAYTHGRTANHADALWLCQHPPVFTQGLAGRAEHVLSPGAIEVVQTDRGGQVTYHGPGQIVAYPLVDLRRRGYFVKEYVHRLEEAVLRTLSDWAITGHRVRGAPGVYVRPDAPRAHQRLNRQVDDPLGLAGLAKISALGVKVHRHCTYHGLALNAAMDLSPFAAIHPCGYVGLQAIDLRTIGVLADVADIEAALAQHLNTLLCANTPT
ncbi:MAG: lipoyl(octanoyl) transferase LipB [Burkholderiaceae bacterium]|jgi:lipoyl(octanoyl) transferase